MNSRELRQQVLNVSKKITFWDRILLFRKKKQEINSSGKSNKIFD